MARKLILVLIVVALLITRVINNRQNKVADLKVGSVFTTSGYEKAGSKVKVIAIDEIEGRAVYSLKIEPLNKPITAERDGNTINISSIGSLPVSRETLEKWGFKITGWEEVTKEELENYQEWQKVKGGYF